MRVRTGIRHGTRWRFTWLCPRWQLMWRVARVAKRTTTWRAGNSPRDDMSKGHVPVCFRSSGIFQFFHVSFLDSTMCHSLGNPHVVSFFVHVSCAYWSTCHFRVAAHGVLWMFHVSVSGCSTRHFHTVARGAFVTKPFRHRTFYWAGSGWRKAHFYHSIPAQPAERTAFRHR